VEASVAVVGCGHWGRNLVRNFAGIGALAAVSDADDAAAAREAAAHGVDARPWDEVLASDVAAVAIAAPAAAHARLAREALEAGKHCFVEKPLALTVADGAAVVAAARAAGRTLMVGHLLQYHPAFLRLRQLVDEGQLGRLQYVYSNRLNLGRIRREEDILWSFAPHDISMVLALCRDEPESVVAVGARYLHQQLADVTTTHLAFPSGVRAHLFVSWLHPFKEQKLVVVGDRGMAVFDDGLPWDQKLGVYRHQIDWSDGQPLPVRAEIEPVALEPDEPLRRECEHFVDCVRTGATPRTDGEEGLRVLKVLAAATESMQPAPPPANTASTRFPGVRVHPSAYVDDDVEIGEGTAVWHFVHVLSGSRIGRDCSFGQNVMVGPNVTVGDGCRVQNNVSLYEGVELGDEVFCGPSCVFTNVVNPRAGVSRRDEFRPTVVGDGATIGANATVVCGNRIGARSFVAAGAVVTSDVPDHALVRGVPARRVGWVSHDGEVLGDDLTCPRSGRRYREVGEGADARLEEVGG
jgi:predicted dehydrogenase/acetyltransferase-like isoleucine patch superfamily enzyme